MVTQKVKREKRKEKKEGRISLAEDAEARREEN
jgi:hypothetical protein